VVTPREIAARGKEDESGEQSEPGGSGEWVRVMDDAGQLVAIATSGTEPGSLHPSIVLI
jgi:hypothetical protein